MTLSFVGQDLCNQSFRGRKDLADADFTGADLRGCDFREAVLSSANFISTKTGKSHKQFLMLTVVTVTVGFAVIGAVAFAFVGEFPSAVAFASILAFAVVVSFAVAGLRAGTFVVAFAVLVSLAFTIALRAYNAFLLERSSEAIYYTIVSSILLSFAGYSLKELIKIIKSATGTDFRGADLTGAKFVNANVRVTDFTNANCDFIDWQGTEFDLCKFPKNIQDDQVRYLCCNPDKGRGKNYTSSNFHNVYLQNVDLVDAILYNANFNGADLREAKLTNADLRNSQALRTDFSGATLTGARIANWGINPETKFENVICTYVYIDEAGKNRKPASGEFAEGDFALLVGEFTNTLDFLFKNEINFSAFQYAMQQMLIKNPEVEISINQTKFLGQSKDALKRSYDVLNTDADKSKLHADFSESYDIYKRLHPEDNQLIRDLNHKVTYLEGEVRTLKAITAEKDERITDLKEMSAGYKEIAKTQATKSNDRIIIGQIQGDPMSDKNQNISLNAGGSMTGITVAGRDISGTVTLTIQQLRDSNTPEAPKLADLLTDLQKEISESNELAQPDKEKALKYLDKIGELANDKEADRDMIGMAIDGILNVVSKAAKLLTPVQAIAEGLRKLLQL